MRKIFGLLIFLVSSVAFAQQGQVPKTYDYTALSAVALNAAAASRTFYIDYKTIGQEYHMRGPAVLGMDMYFDFGAVAGTITTTCTVGTTRDTATRSLTTCTVASGVCALNMAGVMVAGTVAAPLAADTWWWQEIGLPTTPPVIKCVVAESGAPGATDKITVVAYLTWE